MAHTHHVDPKLLERINAALEDIRNGKMVILVDDEDRENEGDLCMAAQFATADAINFMAMYGRGLICITLTEEKVAQLNLPMMNAPGRPGPPLGTAFTVSIEARTGVSTGISAADRAHTIRVAVSPGSKPEDLVTPGHVFPLRARNGGVLVRTGQTEGSVDLARMAGLTPAGVICEIMNDDGTMARMPDLEVFAQKHGIKIVAIADLIQYRLMTERLVRRVAESTVVLDETGSPWTAYVYENATDQRQFLALVKGQPSGSHPALCRVHAGSVLGDNFASSPLEGGRNLREAVRLIEAEGSGVIVRLPPRGTPKQELDSYVQQQAGTQTPAGDHPLREFGLGAQVLADLGLSKIRLLTNNPRKIVGISGYGLEVTETIPLGPGRL
jgi:3,4-dihydroxy 2-butanone 4-phosphate synthase/GTP cyclohydrolase II